ncbi:unnamed protein product [Sympodiomycopsis kandeliae]
MKGYTYHKAAAVTGSLLLLSKSSSAQSTSKSASSHLAIQLPNNIQTCSAATISWDHSTGKAPWTITVAPVNSIPESVTISQDYIKASSAISASWDWKVPNLPDDTPVIVAISDSTGKVSGTSPLQTISKGQTSTTCATPSEALDFVWFPPDRSPKECDDWKLTWQTDKGNSGIKPPVQFTIMPENSTPLSYSAEERDSTWLMPIDMAAGTRFLVAAFDNGQSGTGGVGQVYTVRNDRSSKKACTHVGPSASPGLVAAKETAQPPAVASTSKSTQSTAKTTGKAAGSTNDSNNNGSSDSSDRSSSSSSSHSSSGAIAGGVIGGLLALGLIIAGLWFYLRRRSQKPHSDMGAGSQRKWPGEGEVMPWKWEVIDEKNSNDGHYTNHLRRPSGDPNWPPTSTTSHRSTHDTDGTTSQHQRHISKPSLSSRNVFSVVPDEALFPPPQQQSHQLYRNGEQPTYRVGEAGSIPTRPAVFKTVPDETLFPPPSSSSRMPSRPLQSKVVADSMLFPPPPERDITSLRGYDGGEMSVPSKRVESPPSQRQTPSQGSAPQGTSSTTPSQNPATIAQQYRYIPPPSPIPTSIHDPYAHMSQVYNSPAMKKKLREMKQQQQQPPLPPSSSGTHRREFSDDTAGRLPPAQYPGSRGVVSKINKGGDEMDEEEEEEGSLAYLR